MRCLSSMRLESTTKRSPNRHWQATIYQVFSKKVEERLQEEEDRVNAYLNPRTREALISECRGLLIREHPDEMWESSQSLRGIEDLQRMFSLLSLIPKAEEPLRKKFEKVVPEHVEASGPNAIPTPTSTRH